MAKAPYKLSSVLLGHTADVRSVATFADRTVVSTSRDKTARVWKPTGNGRDYVCSATLKGHTNFVASVCVIGPSSENPKGLIVTGSNDHTICVYVPDETEPATVLRDHKDTVCKLKTGKQDGTFFSSSWDLTAKLWNTADLTKPALTLAAHTAAVWAVADLTSGCIVTGAADKLVVVWERNGSIRHKLTRHADCVRDIAAIKEHEFLTCANDAVVCHWSATLGTCLGSYYGHTNFIYSIFARENGTDVYTSGEDKTIRVWRNGEVSETITVPVQSIWCVDLFTNDDIVAASSDGVVRIFTCDPERYADAELMESFEKEVEATELKAKLELGGITIKDLPDAKALQQPGQKDGQTKIINEGDAVRAYSWSQSEQTWIRIGDVMDVAGATAATSRKQLYNGREYDYVFSIDIQDGVPPLKLPYNCDQDPWHAAQKFLDDNQLSQLFLDQVANFITKNSTPAPTLNSNAQLADPFTGGSRYVPQANSAPCQETAGTLGSESSYIPHTKYLKLEQANVAAISDKLRELNAKQNACKATEEQLDSMVKLASGQTTEQSRSEGIQTLRLLLDWPNEVVFPVLDVARLAVLHKEVNDLLCSDELLQITRKHTKTDAPPSNQMLTFRLLANMFAHETGEKLCLGRRDEILKTLLDYDSFGSKHNQVAIATFLLNLIVALNKHRDVSGKMRCVNVMCSVLPRLNEPEAVFRALVGLGTLLSTDSEERNQVAQTVRQSDDALSILRTMSEITIPASISVKLSTCSKQIIQLLM